MARTYATRPSSFLGLRDPLLAYQLDAAVFAIDEAIDGALERERRDQDMADLDPKGRRKVERSEERLRKVLERVLGISAELAELAGPPRPRPRVEYVWNEAHTEIVAVRELAPEPVSGGG